MQNLKGCCMRTFGLDMGVASIGWSVIEDEELKDCGVRIFTKAENPKTGESLALPRREARGIRRRLSRRKVRLYALKKILCEALDLKIEDFLSMDGVLPKAYILSKDTKTPYHLRTKALDEKLEPQDLARVILHIAKHRGYGNKHAKDSSDREEGKVKAAVAKNAELLRDSKYRTMGELLYNDFIKHKKIVRNKKESYERCLSQEALKAEMQLILENQNKFYKFKTIKTHALQPFSAESSDKEEINFIEAILQIAFFQRPLKDFSDKIGKCQFYANEPRAPKSSFSAMEFVALTRIINIMQNLQKESGEIFSEEIIKAIVDIALTKGKVTYAQLRKELKINDAITFKDPKLDYTKGIKDAEKVAFIEFKSFAKIKKAFGEDFLKENQVKHRQELDEIITLITNIKDREQLRKELEESDKDNKKYAILSTAQKDALANIDLSDHINLSLKALDGIIPLMRKGKRYDEAVNALGLKEIQRKIQKGDTLCPIFEFEPYLANPVAARGLSQLRKVLNALIKKYGKPHKIHLEFARSAKLSSKERQSYEKEQRENFANNQKAKQECEKLGIEPSGKNLLKMKLFREQNEYCVYSGEKITLDDLKDSTKLQADHIYPYSRSYDDSYQNKVLVFIKENQDKGNKTPFEAFSNNKEKWDKILSCAQKLPKAKKRRIINTDFKDKERGFLARNLVDTSYIARLAADWIDSCLEFLPIEENEKTMLSMGEKGSKKHIAVVNGSLTATMRHYWGLGMKDRKGHLHHAVDAIIIGFINAKVVKAFSDFKKEQEANTAEYYAKKIDKESYKKRLVFFAPKLQNGENFRKVVLEKVHNIFVSKPPRKRTRGELHKETFYSKDNNEIKESYGGEEGVKKAIELGKIRQIGTKIVSNGSMVRVDIFKDKKGKFYGVPIYTIDIAQRILPNKAVVAGKDKQGVIKDWLEMDENYTFCFSLYKDDVILIQKKEMESPVLCYYETFSSSNAQIKVEKHNNSFETLSDNERLLFTIAKPGEVKGESIGIQGLKRFEKWQVSPLGEAQKAEFCARESFNNKKS